METEWRSLSWSFAKQAAILAAKQTLLIQQNTGVVALGETQDAAFCRLGPVFQGIRVELEGKTRTKRSDYQRSLNKPPFLEDSQPGLATSIEVCVRSFIAGGQCFRHELPELPKCG